MNHLPGPWKVAMSGEIVTVTHEHGRTVAVLDRMEQPFDAMDNAYLIAAAPVLLETLEQIAREDPRGYYGTMAEKAIAKARQQGKT